jgi:hypothetical protein
MHGPYDKIHSVVVPEVNFFLFPGVGDGARLLLCLRLLLLPLLIHLHWLAHPSPRQALLRNNPQDR